VIQLEISFFTVPEPDDHNVSYAGNRGWTRLLFFQNPGGCRIIDRAGELRRLLLLDNVSTGQYWLRRALGMSGLPLGSPNEPS
jgi:hypothetical protein